MLFPLIKVGFDLFRYNFSHWAMLQEGALADTTGRRILSVFAGQNALWFGLVPFWNLGIEMYLDNLWSFGPMDLLLSEWRMPLWIFPLIFSFGILYWVFKVFAHFREKKKLLSSIMPIKTIDGVQIAYSDKVSSPIFLMRHILVPKSFMGKPLEAVIAHELHHKKRFDHVTIYAIELFCSIFWFIPFLSRWMRRWETQRELCCDLSALKTGIKPAEYVDILLENAHERALKMAMPFGSSAQI